MGKLLYGVGLNDADYKVVPTVDGKDKRCEIYRKWVNLLSRVYGEIQLKKCKTYIGCTVCDDWLVFSNFKKWMEQQDWQKNELDKDLLIPGNKVYSPETCVFISHSLNTFLADSRKRKSNLPTGASYHKATGKYASYGVDYFTKKQVYLGVHETPEEAHRAWRSYKADMANKIADTITDKRVSEALRARY